MLPIYVPRWFSEDEIFPKEFITWCHRNGFLPWMFMDERVLVTADDIRAKYGPTWVNNWAIGGDIRYAGFRPPECKIGGKYSTHRFGRALDLHFKNVTAEEVRNDIKENLDLFPLITRIENNVSWFHFDVANVKRLTFFNG